MFSIDHTNINVMDMEKSIEFYRQAFDMEVVDSKESSTKRYKLTFLKAPNSDYMIELTWLRDKKEPYDLGSNETHICFKADNFEVAHERHQAMNCICYENIEKGIYFIVDPDGYWMEVK